MGPTPRLLDAEVYVLISEFNPRLPIRQFKARDLVLFCIYFATTSMNPRHGHQSLHLDHKGLVVLH